MQRESNLTSIVILFQDGQQEFEMLKTCLESIQENTSQTKTPFEVIVVANGTKEFLSELKKLYEQGKIDKINTLNENVGFPTGNNIGVGCSNPQSKYVVLLNDDTIVTPGWLEKMKKVLDGDKTVGAVGPYTNFASGEQCLQNVPKMETKEHVYEAGKKFRGSEHFTTNKLVFFCVMIRKELYKKYQLWEGYGKGNFEDDDFCWQLINDGHKLKIASCFIYHVGGQNYKRDPEYGKLLARNQKLFMRRIGAYKTISLCMIVSQDEDPKMLHRALRSIYFCVDQINIVINYKKKQNTKKVESLKSVIVGVVSEYNCESKISERLYITPNIEESEWTDFSDMRNKSIEMGKTKSDYFFWLDCDDVMINPLEIRQNIMAHKDVDAFSCEVLSRTESNTVETIRHYRLLKNKPEYRFQNRVHEDIGHSLMKHDAKKLISNIIIEHTGYIDEKVWKKKNERNIAVLEEEIKENPHTLTYYGLVNAILIKDWSKRQYQTQMLRGFDLCNKCIEMMKNNENDPLLPKMYVLQGLFLLRLKQNEAAENSFAVAANKWNHPEAIINLADIYFQNNEFRKCYDILAPMYEKKEFQVTNIPIDLVNVEKHMLQKLADSLVESFTFKRNMAKIKQTAPLKGNEPQKEEKSAYIENMSEKDMLIMAEKIYSEYLTIEKNIYIMDKLSHVLRHLGREDMASFLSIQAVNLNPDYVQGWVNLGAFELRNKRYATAELFYKEAHRRLPKDKMIKHNLKILQDINRKGVMR